MGPNDTMQSAQAKSGVQLLEEQLRQWEEISLEIKEKREAFEKIIAKELANKQDLQEKIFKTMDVLDKKVTTVNGITVTLKSSYWKKQGPTPTEKVTILMSKINEATKKVVQAEFDAKTIEVPVSGTRTIKSDKGVVSEGIGDAIKTGLGKIGGILKNWVGAAKEFFSAVDQLESLVKPAVNESKLARVAEAVRLLEKITGKKVVLTKQK